MFGTHRLFAIAATVSLVGGIASTSIAPAATAATSETTRASVSVQNFTKTRFGRESNSDFTCGANTVMVGRWHGNGVDKGDENEPTDYWCGAVLVGGVRATVTPTTTIFVADEKYQATPAICPANSVLIGRKHIGDEREPTTYRCGSIRDTTTRRPVTTIPSDPVSSRPWQESGKANRTFYAGHTVASGFPYVMTGRMHWGDENGDTMHYITTLIAPTPAPAKPIITRAVQKDLSTDVDLSWSGSKDDVDSYKIWRDGVPVREIADRNATSATITGQSRDRTHTFIVEALGPYEATKSDGRSVVMGRSDALIGAPSDTVTLDRDAPVDVPVAFRAQQIARQLKQTTATLTAPPGTTFAMADGRVRGQLSVDGGRTWTDDTYHHLIGATLSPDGRTISGNWSRGIELAPGQLHRFVPRVRATAQASATTVAVTARLTGLTGVHSFDASSTTTSVIPDAGPALVAIRPAATTLDHEHAVAVPAVIEASRSLSWISATWILAAPPTTSFATGQYSIPVQQQRAGQTGWSPAPGITATGLVNGGGRTATFTLRVRDGFAMPRSDRLRISPLMDLGRDSNGGEADVAWTLDGTTDFGFFQLAGSSPLELPEAREPSPPTAPGLWNVAQIDAPDDEHNEADPTTEWVRLDWVGSTDPDDDLSRYEIEVDGRPADLLEPASASAMQATAIRVPVGDDRRFRVRALDDSGLRSPWSAPMSTSVDDRHAPTAPTGLVFTDIEPTTATASWSSAWDQYGVTGYRYRVDLGRWIDIGDVLRVDLTELGPEATHRFDVRAVDRVGLLGAIASGTFSTPNGVH
jgi:hypothetical protein